MDSITPEDEAVEADDAEKIEIYLSQTMPTVKEENFEHRKDNEMMAGIILHRGQEPLTTQQVVVDKKNEDLIFKALSGFKIQPKTEEEIRQRVRDEELVARYLARAKIEPKSDEEKAQRKRDEEWLGKFLLGMEKPTKTKAAKEEKRKLNEWMAKFMIRTRPELEEDKNDEDDRRKNESMILKLFGNLERPAEKVSSVTERRNDAALLAQFLHPKPKNLSQVMEEKTIHKEEVITEYLMHHEPVKSKLKGNELDNVANYLAKHSLRTSTGFDKIITKEEPQVENYIIEDNDHKKTFGALHGLLGKKTEGKMLQSEIIVERPPMNILKKSQGSPQSIRSIASRTDKSQLDDLRRLEDDAARKIQRRFRWLKTHRAMMAKRVKIPEPNVMDRDRFEDLYVRFMMFCESLPYDVAYEDLFKMFMFYLDESRSRRYLTQNYTQTERKTYIREQYEVFTKNSTKGRAKSALYKF